MKNHTGKNLLIISAVIMQSAYSDIIINSSTADWTPITYGTNTPDAATDQQTGLVSGDIVGDANHHAFYSKFDNLGTSSTTDGTLGFRIRLNEIKDEKKMTFNYNLFVGMDADLNGSIDLFVGVDNSPNGSQSIAIWDPGPDANTGPSTTSIVSPPSLTYTEVNNVNFHFALVSTALDPAAISLDVDGGGKTDAFLSFSIDFYDVITLLGNKNITIDETSGINYVMATATQDNSLNMDLNGVNDGIGSTNTFAALGATSDTFSATGDVIPEPVALGLVAIGGLITLAGRRIHVYYTAP